jgi:hypothetical protein
MQFYMPPPLFPSLRAIKLRYPNPNAHCEVVAGWAVSPSVSPSTQNKAILPDKSKEKKTMYKRHNWLILKTKFFAQDYTSLREFARREGLSYNGNFMRQTKGWAAEKVAKGLQISCEISEKSMKEVMELKAELSKEIDKVCTLIVSATKEYMQNEDYKKFPIVKHDVYKLDDDGNILENKAGKYIKHHVVQFAQSPFIQIKEVKKAIETISKVSRVLHLNPNPLKLAVGW